MSRDLYLGRTLDDAGTPTDSPVHLDADDLTTHGVIVGMTGSGKTGLAISLMEEALLAGVPVLALDPKGDLTNLLLTFPELRPEDFAPWVPEGQEPAEVAATWTEGLRDWGIGPERIAELRRKVRLGVYTPGSTDATPLNLIGSLAAPGAADDEALADEVAVVTAGLLGLVGITGDPLASPPHLLVSNILHDAWVTGESLDLAGLIGRVQTPPMRTLGVMEIDRVIPPKQRSELAVRLNGILATPGFAAWITGAPLDIGQLLVADDGRPSFACVALGHLTDDERQMAVSRILAALIRWFRTLPGTDQLRALVYIDEVAGYVPPTAMPPAKKPILTIMKQARAFGIGMVLATQNPVDLDYKSMSNAGTWLVGRLQTERDKDRLLDGMNTAAGEVDIAALGATITGLGKRQFLLHQTKGDPPVRFGTRWAMSYLRGPVTGAQLADLPGREEVAATGAAAPTAPEPAPAGPMPTEPAPADAAPGTDPVPTPPTDGSAGATGEETSVTTVAVMPKVAEGVPVRFLDPATPWAAQVGAVPASTVLRPMIALRVNLLYDETAADLHHSQEWEAVLPALSDTTDAATAVAVDHDDRDFLDSAPTGATFRPTTARIDTKSFYTSLATRVKDHLVAEQTLTLIRNPTLKLWSRPGETTEEFAARCDAAAQAAADAEADKIRQALTKKIDKVRAALDSAQLKAQQAAESASDAGRSSTLNTVGGLLGGLLGGGSRTRGMANAARRAMSDRERAARAQDRADEAAARVAGKADDLEALEAELAAALVAIDDRWTAVAAAVEQVEVPLEKSDISITMMALLWVPT